MDLPAFTENEISKLPAITLLKNLGYTYLSPQKARQLRGGRKSAVLLEGILAEQLSKLNRIRFKGAEYPFSEGNIQAAIQALKDITYDGLVRTNEKIYDLLCLGRSLQQTIDGDTKSFPFCYIDWNPQTWRTNNVFHVTPEFYTEKSGSHDFRQPDIVLFVNGIPLVVIECKSPDIKDPIQEAISQHLRNQRLGEIPKLFQYTQLLLAISKNEAKYATAGTPEKFWTVWQEKEDADHDIQEAVNVRLSEEDVQEIYSSQIREDEGEYAVLQRKVTVQDRALYALCRPERLLEIMFRYTLFDAGEKKVCRYQQYFCVKLILERIRRLQEGGKRRGGVVWHTQGSGKSLTMVFLAQGLALEPNLDNFKIILVTDRVDLDDQIYKTFNHCGTEPSQARTGKHLAELILSPKKQIITTVIDKFEAVVSANQVRDDNPNIFVLVDEGHRGQYGELHAKMRKVLPNACFIGFTGTPILKKEKNTLVRFGGLIDSYPITQAVADKAVVPLLYEGRHVGQKVDSESIDAWFERITRTLTREQKADLKKKCSTTDQLNKAEQKVMRIAWDVSTHFQDNWQGTPYKAQLVAQDKSTALLYKKYLDQFEMVDSEVLISPPDDRKGNQEIEGDNPDAVQEFWRKMMLRYGSDKEYKKQTINSFKNADKPEIIIVVDMLLTGFDAPRNTVLYLTKMLKGHTLLQAIARVNRLYDGKDFGYIIDYRGVLQNLDHAMDLYSNLSEFEREGVDDLYHALHEIESEIDKLPQRHSALRDVFKTLRNKGDEEEYEQFLADEAERAKFKERLSLFSRTLGIALSSVKFIEETPERKLRRYKNDLHFFMKLRASIRKRYSEVVDFKEYEGKIQKLLDTHVGTGEVEAITDLVNIFDAAAFAEEVEKLNSTASKADTIAHRTKKTITERMEEDPTFYKKFSELLEQAIEDFRQQRLTDAEYLNTVTEIHENVRNHTGNDIPEQLRSHDVAKAFYGGIIEVFGKYSSAAFEPSEVGAEASLTIDRIIKDLRIVNWINNSDVQKRMENAIDDYLFDLKESCQIDLSIEDIDYILEHCLDIARVRYAT